MLETDKVFAGSIPENYDRYMVPLIFEPYAADIARRAASMSPSAVLETAAGTGVVTRALAPKLSPRASFKKLENAEAEALDGKPLRNVQPGPQ
jgi:hypothetical protein